MERTFGEGSIVGGRLNSDAIGCSNRKIMRGSGGSSAHRTSAVHLSNLDVRLRSNLFSAAAIIDLLSSGLPIRMI